MSQPEGGAEAKSLRPGRASCVQGHDGRPCGWPQVLAGRVVQMGRGLDAAGLLAGGLSATSETVIFDLRERGAVVRF